MSRALLELDHVNRSFSTGHGRVDVLRDVTLRIDAGEFVAIVGPSGSGKSTLMNLLGCLDAPSSGEYRAHGVDVSTLDPDAVASLRSTTFGFVFQRYHLMAHLSAVANVAMPAVYTGADAAARGERATALLEQLGLGDRLQHTPAQLSGGQQQRVSIARALVNGAKVILADEPTGALDSESGKEVLATLHALHRQGHTIVLITHDPTVARHAERVITLQDGRIVADETSGATGPRAARVTAAGEGTHITSASHGSSAVVLEAIKMAIHALASNRLRTALTMLGIVIGVGSVVAMVAIGSGAKREVLERIQAMGSDLITVKRGVAAVRGSGRGVVTLGPEDLPVLGSLPGVVAVAPETDRTVLLRYANKDLSLPAMGTNEHFSQIRNWPTEAGAFFSAADVQRYAQVVAIGRSVAQELFGESEAALGKFVLIGNAPYQVVGVMSPKGVSNNGYDRDYAVWLPYTTASTRLFGQRYFTDVSVKVSDGALMNQVERTIHATLLRAHGKEDFNVRNMADVIETANQTQNALTYLLGAIAVISLIVGGIGVMNIMLVSVTERTREIGIRMAVGARRRDVLVQFLTEAVAVCVVGGLAGVALGAAGGWIVARMTGWLVLFSAAPIVLAFCCAFITGVVFGFLPARNAARLDPVVALARE